ncbi:hypothetical protein [Streptomyces mobaraensis]|uniref:Uncharacterized protein n=1 Tax=Streptomyces mobaraensis TaxID=35621 RepID=A0A5N5WCW7_STRMB|nr:hypothetical protein [Streptomyces mobaraensis]KAB7850178.1 hypothetical protein FRZ00_06155 [Streptomyces mobaraensis]
MLRQLVGQRAGLSVIADAQSMPVAEAEEHRTPYRLHWCLRPTSSGHELRWRIDCGPTCTFPHVVDHECPPGTPPGRRPEGALW